MGSRCRHSWHSHPLACLILSAANSLPATSKPGKTLAPVPQRKGSAACSTLSARSRPVEGLETRLHPGLAEPARRPPCRLLLDDGAHAGASLRKTGFAAGRKLAKGADCLRKMVAGMCRVAAFAFETGERLHANGAMTHPDDAHPERLLSQPCAGQCPTHCRKSVWQARPGPRQPVTSFRSSRVDAGHAAILMR